MQKSICSSTFSSCRSSIQDVYNAWVSLWPLPRRCHNILQSFMMSCAKFGSLQLDSVHVSALRNRVPRPIQPCVAQDLSATTFIFHSHVSHPCTPTADTMAWEGCPQTGTPTWEAAEETVTGGVLQPRVEARRGGRCEPGVCLCLLRPSGVLLVDNTLALLPFSVQSHARQWQ